MIKLKDLIPEAAGKMPKGKWIQLSGKALDKFKEELIDLINIAYKPIGGHSNFKKAADIVSGTEIFHAVDLDDDPQPDALNIYKKKSAGMKSVGLGHDGSKPAKSSVINNKVKKLKSRGWYAEVSGKMYDIMAGKGVKVITDYDIVKAILKGKQITPLKDGWYKRDIGGTTMKKIMIGFPRVKTPKKSRRYGAMGSSDENLIGGLIKLWNKIF